MVKCRMRLVAGRPGNNGSQRGRPRRLRSGHSAASRATRANSNKQRRESQCPRAGVDGASSSRPAAIDGRLVAAASAATPPPRESTSARCVEATPRYIHTRTKNTTGHGERCRPRRPACQRTYAPTAVPSSCAAKTGRSRRRAPPRPSVTSKAPGPILQHRRHRVQGGGAGRVVEADRDWTLGRRSAGHPAVKGHSPEPAGRPAGQQPPNRRAFAFIGGARGHGTARGAGVVRRVVQRRCRGGRCSGTRRTATIAPRTRRQSRHRRHPGHRQRGAPRGGSRRDPQRLVDDVSPTRTGRGCQHA